MIKASNVCRNSVCDLLCHLFSFRWLVLVRLLLLRLLVLSVFILILLVLQVLPSALAFPTG